VCGGFLDVVKAHLRTAHPARLFGAESHERGGEAIIGGGVVGVGVVVGGGAVVGVAQHQSSETKPTVRQDRKVECFCEGGF